jgi:hypothetical protein
LGRFVDKVVLHKSTELLGLLEILCMPETMVPPATTVAHFKVDELRAHVKIFAIGPFRAPVRVALVVILAQRGGVLLEAQGEKFDVSGWPVTDSEQKQKRDVGFLAEHVVVKVAGGRALTSLVQPRAANVETLADVRCPALVPIEAVANETLVSQRSDQDVAVLDDQPWVGGEDQLYFVNRDAETVCDLSDRD